MTREEINKELRIAEENYDKVLRKLANEFREAVVIPLCKKNGFVFIDGEYYKEYDENDLERGFFNFNGKKYKYATRFNTKGEFAIPHEFVYLIEEYFPEENLNSIR